MFGLFHYIAAGLIVLSLGFGGYQTVRLKDAQLEVERALTAEASAKANLRNCSNRILNIEEALESNATIPDDLRDFDLPPEWLRGPQGDTTPGSN